MCRDGSAVRSLPPSTVAARHGRRQQQGPPPDVLITPTFQQSTQLSSRSGGSFIQAPSSWPMFRTILQNRSSAWVSQGWKKTWQREYLSFVDHCSDVQDGACWYGFRSHDGRFQPFTRPVQPTGIGRAWTHSGGHPGPCGFHPRSRALAAGLGRPGRHSRPWGARGDGTDGNSAAERAGKDRRVSPATCFRVSDASVKS